jgi:hypothetical protein
VGSHESVHDSINPIERRFILGIKSIDATLAQVGPDCSSMIIKVSLNIPFHSDAHYLP